MTDLAIVTGISCTRKNDERDLETPLLILEQPEESKDRVNWMRKTLTSWTFVNGFWLGFFIQAISLGSTAILAIHWGEPTAHWISKKDGVYHVMFFVLSQSWWILFPIICCSGEGITGYRRSLYERSFFSRSKTSSRHVFLGGVRFHVGIVVGCFVVTSLIDLYFGVPTSVLLTLMLSFVACVSLCYAMGFIHDQYVTEVEELP